MHTPRGLKRAALLLLWLSSRPALAQDCKASPERAGCKPVEVVVTGTRTPESSQRATVRTEFVSREEAERRGATNVAEALAGEATLQVNPEAYGYLGRPSGIQLHGMDADRVLVLEDGERVIGDRDGVVDLAQLPLVDVERIEFVAGPTSSLYGTNALGGVINVVTAPPRTLGPSARYRFQGRSSGEALGSLTGAYRRDDDWLALDTSLHHRPAIPRLDAKPDYLAAEWTSLALGLRAGTRLSRRVELRVKARWVRDDSDGRSSENKPNLGQYVSDLPQLTDRFSVRALETLELGGGARLDFSLARSWFFDETGYDRRDSPLDEVRHRKLQNQGLEAMLTLPDGPARTWVFGVRSDAEQFEQDFTRTTPELTEERVVELEPMQLASGAVFGQLGWKVTEKLTLMPGVRAELHERYGEVVAPRLASAYQLSEQLSARAALGRGFRAPTAKEFGFLFDHSALGYRVLGNRDLSPESSWGLNGDLTWRSSSFRSRVGAFHDRIENLIVTELAPDQPLLGVTDYVYRNVEQARTAGVDVSVRAQLAKPFSLETAYAYLWTRDLGSGEPLPNRPPHTATLAAYFELERLSANARYRFVSDAFAVRVAAQDVRSPSFGLLDARVAYQLLPALELSLGALNLTNVLRDPDEPTDTRPVIGRQFYLALRGELPAE
jgi:outer membrane receptor for ferrienterochelin and colicins